MDQLRKLIVTRQTGGFEMKKSRKRFKLLVTRQTGGFEMTCQMMDQ